MGSYINRKDVYQVKKTIEGSCLCGEVQISLEVDKIDIGICHCDYCRKQNAGPAFTLNAADPEAFHINEWEKVKLFSSSENGQRGFCSNCGTYVCFRSKTTERCAFNAELFQNNLEEFDFTTEIWCTSKPEYYEFNNDTEKLAYE